MLYALGPLVLYMGDILVSVISTVKHYTESGLVLSEGWQQKQITWNVHGIQGKSNNPCSARTLL